MCIIFLILFVLLFIIFILYYCYTEQEEKYDYIICGLGSAGAIIASELAKKGFKVLGIERGENRNDDETVRDAFNSTVPASKNKYSTTYLDESFPIPTPPLYKRNEYVQGKMWGGSTGVNYMVRLRPDKEWHQRLSELVDDNDLSYDSFLKYYKKTETYIGETQDEEQRGYDGKIKITQLRKLDSNYNNWFQGLSNASGTEMLEDYNTGDALVSSPYFQRSLYYDENGKMIRSWSGIYLEDVCDNLTILSNSNVLKVLFKDNKAIGVHVISGQGYKKYYCKKEVIICNGLESSCLLERSGIGQKEI